MADKSNQHYVPKFYFRFFSLDGKRICVLNRKNGLTIEHAPIKGQASKNYYYGDLTVEDRLQVIDGLFSSVLHNLKNAGTFEGYDPKSYVLLLQNLMLQKSRTLSARNKSKPMQDRLLQLYLEVQINNDEKLTEEQKDRFLGMIGNVAANPKQYQNMEMAVSVDVAEYLMDLVPVMLINKTNRPFIFSDAPVVFCNLLLQKITLRGVLGAQTPGLLIFYPLSPKHLILLFDANSYRIKGVRNSVLSVRDLKDVAALNKLQIHNASNAVYFSEYQYSRYVSELWRQEKTKLREHRGTVVEAPGFDHDGEPLGDIVHSFEPQLPFFPDFIFLYHEIVQEKDYRFSRREEYA
ncbi:MAG: DUF4238 domain-containing protein [Planctomycetes bacterium]|uniref:DUF4238 domain-containing protein n=1 Tax=Candidatus Wunengus sp. YC65 TaxID=3367701 RepID=UPI001DFE13AB|nr:DUF4238 domain-containing protein [Planctomycetota bacterium]